MRKKGGKKHKKWIGIWTVVIILVVVDGVGFALIHHGSHNSETITAYQATTVNSAKGSTNGKVLEVSNAGADCSTTTDCAVASSDIYLKFLTSAFPKNKKVESVKLQLYATNISGDGGQVYEVADNNWDASTIDWDNAPPVQNRAIGSVGPVLSYGGVSVSLPPEIIKPNHEITLVIKNNDRNVAAYKSGLSGNGGPSLNVIFGSDAPIAQSNKSYEILAGGDVACGHDTDPVDSSDCHQDQTAKLIGQVKPDDVLVLGDEQYTDGTLYDFQRYFDPTWGQYKSILKPAPGNHEYNNSYNQVSHGCESKDWKSLYAYACGYFDYFDGVNNVTGQAGERGKGYYAFNLGNWRIYAVNSNCSMVDCEVGSDQERWLRNDLAKHVDSCKLMFMHHPISSSDTRNFDTYLYGVPDPTGFAFLQLTQTGLANLYKAFYDFGGDLVLTGHSHFYERFAPQNLNRQADPSGYREIVVGTGGRYTYDVDFAHIRPNSVVHSKWGDHGLLKLNLESNSYSWNFMPTAGTHFSDSGASTCHAGQ
jgi:hypothetical protein